jgi:hypothetical protein
MQGTIELPTDQAGAAVQRWAADNGYSVDPAASGPMHVVLRKGMTAMSWGSAMTVAFQAVQPTQTVLQVTTKETMALTDWGRGKRAIQRMFEAIGAQPQPAT